jgi:hypothetical protein
MKTRRTREPTNGTGTIRYHQPDLSASWRRRTLTDIVGEDNGKAKFMVIKDGGEGFPAITGTGGES